jgi:predicted dehydrogenase
MKKIRLGVVGTGLAVERLHLPALKRLKDRFVLQACAGRDAAKARAFAKRHGFLGSEGKAEALLKRKDVDALLLCLPIELNAAWALKALRAGKPSLCEKPVAAERSQARKLMAAASAKGAPLMMVAENYVFWPHMAAAVDIVSRGKLGAVRLALVHHVQDARRSGEWLTAWRTKPRFKGGFVLDGGVHWAALLNRILGQPKRVHAAPSLFDKGLPPMDAAAALIEYKSGARALWATAYSASAGPEPLLSVHGDQGSLAIYWDRAEWRQAASEGVKVLRSPMDSYEAEWRHFHDALTRGTRLGYSLGQAVDDLDLMLKVCAC